MRKKLQTRKCITRYQNHTNSHVIVWSATKMSSTQTKIPYNWDTLDDKVTELYDAAIEEFIEENNTEEAYESELNEIYGDVSVCGYDRPSGAVLREVDPIAFRCGLSDNEDRVRERAEEETDQDEFREEALEILNMEDEE